MKTTIYHNPRCGKSRAALKLLADRGLDPAIIEYLKTPPSAAELKRLLKLMDLSPRELMRRKEPAYAALKLDRADLSDAALIAAMVKEPILIERPIVVVEGKGGPRAALGRPPEKILDIL